MENKVRFKLHKVKKHWITIAASSLAIGASLIGLGQVGADEVKPETTAVISPENVVSDSNLETSASLITRTEVAPTSTVVENTSSAAVSTDTTPTNVATQPTETTATQPSNEADKKVETAQSSETTIADRGAEVSSETSDNVTTSQETPSQGGKFTSDDQGNWYYTKDGKNLTGWNNVEDREYYFQEDGKQVKGQFVEVNGKNYYLDDHTGMLLVNCYLDKDGKHYQIDENGVVTERTKLPTNITGGHFEANDKGEWSYITSQGEKLTGFQYVDGVELYFDKDGKQLKGQEITVDGKTYYLDHNTGALLKNSYRNWSEKQIIPRYKTNYIYHTSYFNRDGIRATGLVKTAAGFIHYFDENGELLKNVAVNVGDTTYVFGERGRLARNSFIWDKVDFTFPENVNFYYGDEKGHAVKGLQTIDGYQLYFDKDGRQAKDKIVQIDGKTYYFDKNNGRMVKNQWASVNVGGISPASKDYRSYYLGNDGAAVTGWQDIDGERLYFTETGLYAHNGIYSINGKNYLFDPKGQLVKNAYGVVDKPGSKVRFKYTYRTNADGEVLTGKQIIDGKEYIFGSTGQVVDGVVRYDGKLYLVKDSKIEKNYFGAFFSKNEILGGINFTGIYGTDENGVLLEGVQRGLDGQLHYFQPEVKSVNKPTWKEIDGKRYRLTKWYLPEHHAGMYTTIILTNDTLKVDDKTYTIDNEGVATEFTAKNQFVRDDNWNWYYYDTDGKLLTGRQTIDGIQLYFDANGKQAKGTLIDIDGDTYYFDKDSGAMWTNRSLTLNGMTYEIDDQGRVTSSLRNTFVQDKDGDWTYLKDKGQVATGWQTIDGIQLYFDGTGKQIKGERILIDGKYYHFDKNSGELLRNAFHSFNSYIHYFGNDGAQVFGWYTLDGHRVYFKENGIQAKDDLLLIDGNYYYFNQDGQLLVNGSAKSYNSLYLADSEGKLLSGWREIDGKTYYLDPSNQYRYINTTETINGKTYLFGSYAELLRNETKSGYVSDENGIVRIGFYRTDKGYLYYLEPRVIEFYQPTWKEIDGKLYHFEKSTSLRKYLYGSPITTNATLEKDGKTYVIDENGVATEKVN
ncbi:MULTISPECIES: KxYKxGKxW signal peptide domain-containing protein [Streptococcus]|uniref:KxYKxGKxW signal peptide domain-containing protein n=1 Tax=Streptococcus TaxID=1301 RepID=UPI0012BC876E|nr:MULTISPECIES: KxYKxGKxW signal peptide domain-containing protein [Streptococcus]MBK5077804.1 KxYKxGKxW signal peptide domain-containing protein [Streptococcus sp. 22.1]MTQ56519.1 choline-binding protein [Streptococcus salivarius]MTQ58543.1 choline-binding protein [Streptococcus salivarius]MTQ64182.1 choline-binding protein [Streptococcus salivarius]MTQ66553.1 choline-binding protein [Streptococcus salivarius]